MILELDIGNTRSKWRLLDGGQSLALGALDTAALKRGELPVAWSDIRPRRLRAANVAGEAVADALAGLARDRFGVEAEFARVRANCAGVTCGYREPGRLGVDRWLSVLAAHRLDPRAALIVDCGSAVTLDLLDTGGQHLGGYILPGLGPMRRALYSDTDAVKVERACFPGMSLAPGQDTGEAVNRGLPLMVLGAVEHALAELRRTTDGEPLLWLTGGDGEFFSSLFSQPHELIPELVLDGLALSNP